MVQSDSVFPMIFLAYVMKINAFVSMASEMAADTYKLILPIHIWRFYYEIYLSLFNEL